LALAATLAFRAGRIGRAARLFSAVLAIDPNDTYASSNLVQIARTVGDLERAAAVIDAQLRRRPLDADLHRQLCEIRFADPGQVAYLLRTAKRLAVIRPDGPEAYPGLVRGMLHDHGPTPALRWGRIGATVDPLSAWTSHAVADALDRLRKDGRQFWVQRALVVDPGEPEFWRRRAEWFEVSHQPDAAILSARRSIQAGAIPGTPRVTIAKALIQLGRLDEAEAVLRALVSDTSASISQRATANFELGIMLDKVGRVDEAFDVLLVGNRLARRTASAKRFDPKRMRDGIEARIAGIEAMAARGEAAPAGMAPVFLVGFPRSGTTLLEQILDSHPRITALEERPYITRARRWLDRNRPGAADGSVAIGKALLTQLRSRYSAMLDADEPRREGVVRIDKLPFNLIEAGLITRLFPDARFILAIRHPADVCLSNFMQEFAGNDLVANLDTVENTARLYDQAMRYWVKACDAFRLTVHRVRYEDLVADLEGEARKVVAFLNLPFDPAMLDHAAHARGRAIRTPSYRQVSQPIYTHARYRWLRYRHLIEPALEILDPWIEHWGYAGDECPGVGGEGEGAS